MRHWDTDEGLPSHTISDIKQAPDGYLWMATTAGVIRFDGTRFTVFDRRNAGLRNPRATRLGFTATGGLRVYLDDQSIMESPSRDAPRFSLVAPSGAPPPEPIGSVDLEARGMHSFALAPGWKAAILDRFGGVWLQAPDSIAVRRPADPVPFWSHQFPAGTSIRAMTEDAEGDIWVGTLTDGLYRIKPVAFRVYGEEAGIADAGVADVSPGDDGAVFLSSANIYYILRDGKARRIGPVGAESTFRDLRGTVWSLRLSQSGSFTAELAEPGRPGPPRAVRFDSLVGLVHLFQSPGMPNVLWGRDMTSVYRIALLGEPGTKVETIAQDRDLRQALVDRAGALWYVSSGGIFRIHGEERSHFTEKDGLPTNQVRSVHEDARGNLWFGTYGSGLVRYQNGHFQCLDEAQGLAEGVVNTILEDGAGNFWMSGNHGIQRAPLRDLEAVLDGRASRVDAILYGRSAGLLNPESNGTPGAADPSGRFWFTTFDGVAVVDPALALALEATPVPVRVETLTSLPRAAARKDEGGFTVPSGPQSVEIGFTAIALRDPDNVRFQYRLEGFDPGWMEAGARRTTTYTRLPPGTYTFHVRAFVTPGRWIELATPVPVVVMPAFHQTGAFKALAGMAVLAAAFAAYRLRTRVLRRRAARLETTVEERTHELAREKETVASQVEQLQELERAKSRFFANVSHEFRTPLTLIQGPLEDLQHGLHGPFSEDAREQLEVATRSSHRLLQLVDQLLDIARAESGRLSVRARRGDFRLFLRRAAGALAPLAERKGVALEIETPDAALPLWFDPEHLEKVLLNVIGNAVKFTPAGGHVRVVVRGDGNDPDPNAGWLVVEVTDDGPGIAPEDLPRIFDRFHRGGGTARSQPGAGIGLALARELVTLHGGTIQAESLQGEGSTFTIRLPRGRAHLSDAEIAPEDEADLLRPVGGSVPVPVAAEVAVPPPESAVDRPLPAGLGLDTDVTTVLVADDNEDVRRYVRGRLEQQYRVLEAADGREALEIVRRALPDLVVSDVMMPVLDGFALCRAIKSDPETDYIPVVLLTARASSDSRIEGLEEGADDYLTKPFNVRELETRIRNLIASRRRLQVRFSGSISAAGPAAADAPESSKSDGTGTGDGAGPVEPVEGVPYVFSIGPGAVTVPSADVAFLEQVRAAVEARLGDEDLDVEALAQAVGTSRASLYRRLKDLLDQSPMGLIRKVRLEQAAALLAQGDGAIGEIAYAVGFRSVAHFAAVFKEQYGTTPSAYRRARADRTSTD